MTLQTLFVALIVPACAVYAAWQIAPAALKRRVARKALQRPRALPRPLVTALRRAAADSHGCGCDGCDAAPKTPGAAAPITLHRHRG